MGQDARPTANLSGLVDVLKEIGNKRAAVVNDMRAALERTDVEAVLDCARRLCGLSAE